MPIQINTDLFTVIGITIGVVGLFLAVFQTITAQRVRKTWESHCRSKCKDIVALTKSMTEEALDACEAISMEMQRSVNSSANVNNGTAFLAAKVNGIRLLTGHLASFCDGLNDEHKDQFGRPVFESMDEELPRRECLAAMRGLYGHNFSFEDQAEETED